MNEIFFKPLAEEQEKEKEAFKELNSKVAAEKEQKRIEEEEARKAIKRIGKPALGTLMEVLISPLQSVELKDKVALIIGEMGDISSVPALRSYYEKEMTPAGSKALLMVEESVGR